MVDLSAVSGKDSAVALTDTYSFHRFGFDEILGEENTSNIYVNISGQGGKYKSTAWKRSNAENAYFGS